MRRHVADQRCWVIAHGAGLPVLFELAPGQEIITGRPSLEVFSRHFEALGRMHLLNPAYRPSLSATDPIEDDIDDPDNDPDEPLPRDD